MARKSKAWMRSWRPVINGREWRIVFKRNLTLDGSPCWGTCDPESRTICIDSSVKGSMLLSTIVHECLHAMADEHGFKLNHKKLNPLEKAITTFLLENGFYE